MKLKGIDGGPHKRWSTWLNSMQSEEPYQGLTCRESSWKRGVPSETGATRTQVVHGCRQFVPWGVGFSLATSATLVFSCHYWVGTLNRLLVLSRRKARITSSHHAPYALGDYYVLQWTGQRSRSDLRSRARSREGELTPKTRPQFGLQTATRLHEVGIASNRWSATRRWIRSRVLYTPPVTLGELALFESFKTWTARKGMQKARRVTKVKS